MSPFGKLAVCCVGVLFLSTAFPSAQAGNIIGVGFGAALILTAIGGFK
jgi:hypothetical protein